MPRIALTGGIGSGKSTVASILAELGAVIVDADKVAREVVEPGTSGFDAVVERFGSEILLPDGAIDRPALGRIVFADDAARADLNAIVHPRVGSRMQELIGSLSEDAVQVHDIPLLVENSLYAAFETVIVVQAPMESRLERLTSSRPLSRDDALAVMAKQATDEQRAAVATHLIDNSGSYEDLRAQVEAIWPELLAAP